MNGPVIYGFLEAKRVKSLWEKRGYDVSREALEKQ